jgi:Ca2+/Na+ antiporter
MEKDISKDRKTLENVRRWLTIATIAAFLVFCYLLLGWAGLAGAVMLLCAFLVYVFLQLEKEAGI